MKRKLKKKKRCIHLGACRNAKTCTAASHAGGFSDVCFFYDLPLLAINNIYLIAVMALPPTFMFTVADEVG